VACQNGGAEPGARLQRQQVGPGVAEWLQAEPCHRCRPCIRDSQFHSDKWVLKAAPCALHLSSESSQKCPHNYSALSMQKVVSIGHGQDHDVDTPPPPPSLHTHTRTLQFWTGDAARMLCCWRPVCRIFRAGRIFDICARCRPYICGSILKMNKGLQRDPVIDITS
jgi:hypothetical protein